MIIRKLVNGIHYEGKEYKTYALLKNGFPLFIPCQWLLYISTHLGAPKNTLLTYSSRIKIFLEVLDVTIRDGSDKVGLELSEVTESEIQGFLIGHLITSKQRQASTYKNYHAAISELFSWAHKNSLLPHMDIPLRLKEVRRLLASSDASELKKLQNQYLQEDEFLNNICAYVLEDDEFKQERDELTLHLGYYAGFRTHEVTHLKNLDVEKLRDLFPKNHNKSAFNIKHLNIFGKGSKDRTTPFPPKLLGKIHRFLWGRAKHIKNGPLICHKNGKPILNDDHASEIFKKARNLFLASNTIGSEEHEQYTQRTFHILRKCMATNSVKFLVRTGLSPWIFLPQWLGHESLDTTKLYILFDALLHDRLDIINQLSLEEHDNRKW